MAKGDRVESLRAERRHRSLNELFLYDPLKGGLYLPWHFFARAQQIDDRNHGF